MYTFLRGIQNSRRKSAALFTMLNVLMLTVLGCFAFNRDSFDNYMSVAAVTFIVTETVYLFSAAFNADSMLVFAGVFLYELGITVQVILSRKAAGINMMQILSFVFAAGCIFCYEYLKIKMNDKLKIRSKEYDCRVLILVLIAVITIAITAVLMISKQINGAHAWISLGAGRTFQLTEFYKPLFILFTAVLYSSDIKKTWIGESAYFGLIMVSLILENELGTLVVIFLLFVTLSFLFEAKKRIAAYYIGAVVGTASAGLLAGKAVYAKTCKVISLGETPHGILSKIASMYAKVKLRFDVFSSPGELDVNGSGMQAARAREAVIKGGLLGTHDEVSIPVASSDYAFISVVLRMGLVFGILLIAFFVLLFVRSVFLYLKIENKTDSVALAGCGYTLLFSMLIPVFGNANWIPATGIACPFIAAGGTSLAVSTAMLIMLVYYSAEKRPQLPLIGKVKRKIDTLTQGDSENEIFPG